MPSESAHTVSAGLHVVSPRIVLTDVKILLQLGTGTEAKLGLVIPAVITEEKFAAGIPNATSNNLQQCPRVPKLGDDAPRSLKTKCRYVYPYKSWWHYVYKMYPNSLPLRSRTCLQPHNKLRVRKFAPLDHLPELKQAARTRGSSTSWRSGHCGDWTAHEPTLAILLDPKFWSHVKTLVVACAGPTINSCQYDLTGHSPSNFAFH
ncbi:hypothetical protein PsorP6_015136 [Peronosclerospora sorghi]|uniref:Uncharacterized protein n=1 Tax=Peronosclerospora sorghi TaxID=230839 RepID=A0ACC0VUS0_9STRA|nr:hypothetical protein PsorP6_015136 [Peronosclerospora sorghi]